MDNNYKLAIDDFSKSIKLNPIDARTYNDRGLSYFKKGSIEENRKDYNKAIKDYSKAIKLNSNIADVYYNRGIAYLKKGNQKDANKDFSTAIKLDSSIAEKLKIYIK
jgi:Flp pilus assembly protein TadD